MAIDLPDPHPDRYDVAYTEKLWRLLPEIYRAADADDFDPAHLADPTRKGPLRELVERIGPQAAVVRRSIDRLWEDQSIETCDDWLIDYLGDLLATNLVASLDARGRRLDVANTIHYRRRKGTVALLEDLATDITGWTVRVVEAFQRLARTRHSIDPAIGLPARPDDPRGQLQRAQHLVGQHTRTPAGGFADLRDVHGANLTHTAFDEYFHTADVRRGRGMTGWHNIPRLVVFTWRIKSFGVHNVTPVGDTACPNQFTFDPTGRDVPLFGSGAHPHADEWIAPREYQVPGPITADLLEAAFTELYQEDRQRSVGVRRYVGGTIDPYLFVPPGEVKRTWHDTNPAGRFWIDPQRGRIVTAPGSTDPPFRVDYYYGFSTEIGAGAYVRSDLRPAADPLPAPISKVKDGGSNLRTSLPATPSGTVSIEDSLTYDEVANVANISHIEIRATTLQRPLIRPAAGTDWVFTGSGQAHLVLEGLFVSGADIVLRGKFDRVTLSCCTFDPGRWDAAAATWAKAADTRPLAAARIRVEGAVRTLEIMRCITGPIVGNDKLESLSVQDSIIQAVEPGVKAIAQPAGEATLSRCTLLGPAGIHRLHASECILHDTVIVNDTQRGCVRFSAWANTSLLPRKYESLAIRPNEALFASLDFSQPRYAQLLATVTGRIVEGGEDGSEMGAFAREKTAIKERSLLIKYQEYLPLGMEPVIVHVT